MLGKQGWKIATNQDALVSQVFKAKYYPNGDFLGARLGHNPSYLWRNIHTSRVAVKLGLRWRIGDGRNIGIWHQPWVRTTDSSMVTTPPVVDTENWTVAHLIDESTSSWKHDVVTSIFNSGDAENILNMPLPCVRQEDTPIWKLSRNGIYSVKSAYYGVMETLVDNNNLKVPGDWMRVWKLKVPPKVKLLTWRILRGVLPTRTRLNTKGVSCPSYCPFCEVGEENDWHIFFGCNKAWSMWRVAGLEQIVRNKIQQAAGCRDSIFLLMQCLAEAQRHDFVMVLWALWKCRNDKVWNNEETNVEQSLITAKQTLIDWEMAKKRREPNTTQQQHTGREKWQKPAQNTVKCNVDAAVFLDQLKFGYGMCIRNHLGEFICAKTMVVEGTINATEAEARGMWGALSWVRSLGFQNVIFELDCKYVVDNIQGDTNCHTEVGVIINTCKETLRQHPNYSVSYIRRQANSVAHLLARASRFYASHPSFDYIPACILDSILKEME